MTSHVPNGFVLVQDTTRRLTPVEISAVINLLGGIDSFETATPAGKIYQEFREKGFLYIEVPEYIPGAVSIQQTADVTIARILSEGEVTSLQTLLGVETFKPAIERGTMFEAPYDTPTGSGMWSMCPQPEPPPAK